MLGSFHCYNIFTLFIPVKKFLLLDIKIIFTSVFSVSGAAGSLATTSGGGARPATSTNEGGGNMRATADVGRTTSATRTTTPSATILLSTGTGEVVQPCQDEDQEVNFLAGVQEQEHLDVHRNSANTSTNTRDDHHARIEQLRVYHEDHELDEHQNPQRGRGSSLLVGSTSSSSASRPISITTSSLVDVNRNINYNGRAATNIFFNGSGRRRRNSSTSSHQVEMDAGDLQLRELLDDFDVEHEETPQHVRLPGATTSNLAMDSYNDLLPNEEASSISRQQATSTPMQVSSSRTAPKKKSAHPREFIFGFSLVGKIIEVIEVWIFEWWRKWRKNYHPKRGV